MTPPTSAGWVRTTEAIGLGVVSWCNMNPVNLLVIGPNVGSLGLGTVTGKLIVPPAPPLVIGAFIGAGMVGVKSAEVATAVSLGVSMSFTQSGMYTGPSAGVSIGANVGKIISANGPALGGLILGYFTSMGMTGTNAFQLAMGAGNGIASQRLFHHHG